MDYTPQHFLNKLPEITTLYIIIHGIPIIIDYTNSFSWNIKTVIDFTSNMCLEMLKLAIQQGTNWDPLTSIAIIRYFTSYFLKYTDQNKFIVEKGCIEILKWSIQNGCKWEQNTSIAALEHKCLKILKWIVLNGCPWNVATNIILIRDYELEEIKWFILNNYINHNSLIYYYFTYKKSDIYNFIEWFAYNSDVKNHLKKDNKLYIYYLKLYKACRYVVRYKLMCAKYFENRGMFIESMILYNELGCYGLLDATKKVSNNEFLIKFASDMLEKN